MGNTWTVSVWVISSWDEEYHTEYYWQGESFFLALYNFFKARETGSGCIKLEYRGR